MELIEAINLASSKESLSFTQIKEVNEVLSANKYKDKVVKQALTNKAAQTFKEMQQDMSQMDLEEVKAAIYVLDTFTASKNKKSAVYKQLMADLELKMQELEVKSKLPNQDDYEHQPKINENATAEEINRNYTLMAEYANQENPLDDKNAFYQTSRDGLDILDVQDENGNTVDVKDEIVETAKLQTMAELLTSKEKVTQDRFRKILRDKIDLSVFTMLNADKAAEIAQSGNTQGIMKDYTDMVNKFVSGGKKNKTKVKSATAIAVITDASQQIDSFTNKIAAKFGNIPAVAGFKQRLSNLDARMSKKFGKAYKVTKEIVKGGAGLLTDLGLATLAGAAGPVGLGLYGVYTFKKYAVPYINKFDASGLSLTEYAKQNPKDFIIGSLYTASSVLSGVVAAGIAAHNAATHAGVTIADSVTKFASTGKIVAGASAMAVKQSSDIYKAVKEGKDVGKTVAKALTAVALFAVAAEAREQYELGHAGSQNDTPDVVNNITNNNTTNIYIDNCCEPVVYPNDQVVEPTPTPTPEPTPTPTPEPTPVVEKPLPPVERTVSRLPIPEIDMGNPPHIDIDMKMPENGLIVPEADLDPGQINVQQDGHLELVNRVKTFDNTRDLMPDHADSGYIEGADGRFYDQPKSDNVILDRAAENFKQEVEQVKICLDNNSNEVTSQGSDGKNTYNSVQELLAKKNGGRNS